MPNMACEELELELELELDTNGASKKLLLGQVAKISMAINLVFPLSHGLSDGKISIGIMCVIFVT